MDARNKSLINHWGLVVLLLALLLALGGCRKSTQTPTAVPATPSTGQAAETTPESTEVPTMQITLNEGQPAQQVVPTLSPAPGEPLSEAEVEALLGRVPPLATETGDVQEFRLASQPIPPPRPARR